MKKILGIIAGLALVFTAIPVFATSYPVGGVQYYLSGAGVNATQSTIQLTSLKTADGRNITMTNFGTIGYAALEPQTNAKLEDITFTGITQNSNGTATLTGVTRGLDFLYPYATSATLAHSHSGGSTLIITNTAGFYYNEFAMPPLSNDNTWPTASTSISTKGYVDYVAFNGAAVINADTINKGVVEVATQLEAASSTTTGGTGATVVIPASTATSTYNAATSPLRVVMTQNSGKIDSNFIATSSLGITTATSTYFTDFTGSGTWTKPSGLTGNEVVLIQAWGAGGGGGIGNSGGNNEGGGGGGGGSFVQSIVKASSLGSTVTVTIGAGGTSGAGGGSTTFGTIITAFGGGAGVAGVGSSGVAGGGGGGAGFIAAGSNGSGSTGGAGGGFGGGVAGADTSSSIGGAGGGTGNSGSVGGRALNGGGGGGSSNSGLSAGLAGGAATWGGAGGGGGGLTGGAGGASTFGGTGATGGAAGATGGTATQPGGGGGGGGSGTTAGGVGGAGEVRVWVITS